METVVTRLTRGLGLLGVWLVLAIAGPRAIAETPVTFDQGELVIESATGLAHRFAVEIASTNEQRSRGLMFRESMAPDAGMLFVYGGEQQIRMWMKNTLIPLDMLFVAADGRIVSIAAETEPLSLEVIASGVPALGVIELNGGTARRLGILPGDRVRHPAFAGD